MYVHSSAILCGLGVMSTLPPPPPSLAPPPQSLHAPRAPVAAMCAVNSQRDPQMTTMWVATEHGELYILHAGSRKLLLDRQLAIYRGTQGIVSILHMPLSDDHSVVVIRKDGCLLLFDDEISQHKFSDDPQFDNCRFDTPLPVKSVVKTRNDRLVYSALVRDASNVTSEIWCGCDKGEVQLFQFSYGKLEYATNVSYSSFPGPAKWTRKEECYVAQLVLGKNSATKRDQVWGLVQPEGVIMCWDAQSKQAVKQLRCSNFTGYQGEERECILIARPPPELIMCMDNNPSRGKVQYTCYTFPCIYMHKP